VTADTSPWSAAACAGRSYLYEAADLGHRWATAECMRLCREVCPIQALCLESTLAYEADPRHGGDSIHLIAGGMLPAQRAALLGKRYRNHHQTLKVTT
jgi:hypothetical protein